MQDLEGHVQKTWAISAILFQCGLLCGIVACSFGLLGFPGTIGVLWPQNGVFWTQNQA